jgi:hypothetical protein
VVSCCECGDECLGSYAMESVSLKIIQDQEDILLSSRGMRLNIDMLAYFQTGCRCTAETVLFVSISRLSHF